MTRHQFYLPDELTATLELIVARSSLSKTAIMTEALQVWIDRRATNELNDRFGARLDRYSQGAERMEHKVDILTEALGVLIRHQLTMTAHQPAFDAEANRLGRLRYDEFVRLIARALARGDLSTRLQAIGSSIGPEQA